LKRELIDMINLILPSKYAEALFLAAKNNNSVNNVKQDLDFILKVFNDYPELEKIICHPVIVKENKKNIIEQIFINKISNLTLNFLFFLIDRKRENILKKVYEIYTEKTMQAEGIKKLEIETAIKLTPQQKNTLAKVLEKMFNKKIYMDLKVNKGILGGVIIKDKMKLIDASLNKFLINLKDNLKSGRVDKITAKKKEIKKVKSKKHKK